MMLALQQRLTTCELASLSCSSFEQAAHALACLARELPACKPALAKHLWQMLPPPATWQIPPAHYMRSAHCLFDALAESEFTIADAQTIFAMSVAQDKAPLFAKASTLELFLYIWALHNLWSAKLAPTGQAFKQVLPAHMLQCLQESTALRAQKPAKQPDECNTLALIGLLSFLQCPPAKPVLQALAKKHQKIYRSLCTALLHTSFVPAYFGLHALEQLYPTQFSITPIMRGLLLRLAQQYPYVSPAVQALCATLKKR